MSSEPSAPLPSPQPSSATEPATLLSVLDGVATITLNRPGNRNALSQEMVLSILDSLRTAVNDPAVRVIVFTGNGPVFCAGADLKERLTANSAADTDGPPLFVHIFEEIQRSPKPVVAKLNGSALAGGLGLACSCDIVIAPDTAMFGFTEVRIGVAPAIISVVCLPRLRHADAAELFLTGERIGAAEALRVGLINRCVPVDQVEATTNELVGRLLLGGPEAIAATKKLLREVPSIASRTEAFATMAKLSGQLFASAEASEGMAAFAQKRKPSWVPEQA
jgi:methylglutaconyl-CoA hydratase